jgi:manganese/iron transport system permease protein
MSVNRIREGERMFELLRYEFMQRALAASIFGGITCGIAGVWIILLNIPFIGVAMSHAAFAGAVLGLLLHCNPLVTALLFCLASALLIGPIADRGDFSPNMSVSVIFSCVLGVAFLCIGLLKGPRAEALNFLWGNILTVSAKSIVLLAVITLAMLAVLKLLYKEILAVLFNREIAKAAGIPETTILYLLLALCGMTVALNLNTVGGLLIFSLITASPLAAYQLTYDLGKMYFLSSLFGVLACLAGLCLSYLLDLPSGAVIIMVASLIFMICMIFSPKRRQKMMNRRQFFDMHAARWDAMVPQDMSARIERDLVPRFGLARAGRVLDVGSGTGILLPLLRTAVGDEGKVVALDYSAPMLKKAEEKYGNRFTYVCADAGNIPFPNGYFDAVLCFSVFPHFPRKGPVLKEFRRVLRDGGRLIIAHADSRETINAFHRKAGGPVRRDLLPDTGKMRSLLKSAGFQKVVINDEKDAYLVIAGTDRCQA